MDWPAHSVLARYVESQVINRNGGGSICNGNCNAQGIGHLCSLPCQTAPWRVTMWGAKLESDSCFLSMEPEEEEEILIRELERIELYHGALFLTLVFSHSVASESLRPHGLDRLLCPSLSPRVCPNSCPLSWWCHPTTSSSSPAFRCSQHQSLFQWVSSLHRGPKYWSFNFSISPSNEYSGLISSRIDWFDLLTVEGTLKSLLKHHSSKASILWCSAFFMVQLSHPYKTTGKTVAVTRQTFVGKVMLLLFNTLPMFVIAFLPRSRRLLISWLQSLTTMILICHCFHFLPIYLPWSDGNWMPWS